MIISVLPPPHNAQTYEWHIHPSEAGTVTQKDTTMTLNWAPGFEGVVALRARAVNECGPSEWSVFHWADVHTCIGITEPAQGSLRLWPNPATGSFTLQLPAGATLPATLALSDLSGRVVLRQPLTETLSTIDCSKLVEGVYFWRVSLGDDRATGKIMIQNSQ